MPAKQFVLVDHSLQSGGGHHASYNLAIAKAAEQLGFAARILGSKFSSRSLRDLPNFTAAFSTSWSDRELPDGLFAPSADINPVSDLFGFELIRALEEIDAVADADSHVLIHSIGFYETAEILRALLAVDLNRFPWLHLLCRRDLDEVAAGSTPRLQFEQSIRCLAGLRALGLKIRFYTDTDQLAFQYTKATGIDFEALPLPLPMAEIRAVEANLATKPDGSTTRFCYLGDARDEKGYHHIAEALTTLPQLNVGPSEVEFHVQSNFNTKGGEPLAAHWRARLQRMKIRGVTLYLDPLSLEDYLAILCRSDVVVIPYEVGRYRYRSSSVFYEAIVAGCIPVVPAGTSMAQNLPTDFPTIFTHAYQLKQIISMIPARRDELKTALSGMRDAWRARHNPDKLVAQLVKGEASAKPLEGRDRAILVQYDLESFYYKVGTARTMRLQTWALQSLGFTVLGLFVVHHSLTEHTADPLGKPSFWSVEMDRTCRELNIAGGWLIWYGREDGAMQVDVIDESRRRQAAVIPKSLPDFIRRNRPFATLINYVFNVPLVDKLGLRQDRLIVETHDLQTLHRSLYDAELDFDANLAHEVDVLTRGDAVSCVTEFDASFLRHHGVGHAEGCIPIVQERPFERTLYAGCQDPAEVLSAGGSSRPDVDIETAWATGATDQVNRLYAENTIDLLFLASWHKPNISGFDWFYNNVFKSTLESRGVNCFVVGGLASESDRFPSPKIFWGGRLDRVDVAIMAAKIVIAPIFEGTGINVKILEALEFNKPIVATSVALRGMPGAQALGCFDTPQDFGGRILELLGDRRKRLDAACCARQLHRDLASSNDYRRHFAKLLGITPDATVPAGEAGQTEAVLNEFGKQHVIVNRFIRMHCELLQAHDMKSYWYDLAQFIDHGDDALLKEHTVALYVDQSAPRLATKGMRRAFSVDQLASSTADEVLLKFGLTAIEHCCLPRSESTTIWYGYQTIGDALVCSGASSQERRINDLRGSDAKDAGIQADGFDFVVWAGALSSSEAGVSFFCNDVVKASPELADKKILLVGDVLPGEYDDEQVYCIGEVEDPSWLPAFGKTIICTSEGRQRRDPRWLKFQLAALAMKRTVLSFENGSLRSVPALGRDIAAWYRAIEDRDAAPTQTYDEIRSTLETFCPRFTRWLDELAAQDCHWSRFHSSLGALFTRAEQAKRRDSGSFVAPQLALFDDSEPTPGQIATLHKHLEKARHRSGSAAQQFSNVLDAIGEFALAYEGHGD